MHARTQPRRCPQHGQTGQSSPSPSGDPPQAAISSLTGSRGAELIRYLLSVYLQFKTKAFLF